MSSSSEESIAVIDAHHHFWDLQHCRYPWLMAKGVKRFFGDPTPIQKNYLPADLERDAGSRQLKGTVHIQVGVADEDSVRETLWLQSLHEANCRLPSAIVGFADLTSPELPMTLEAHLEAKSFRGIRQIIGRHPSEDRVTKSDDVLNSDRFVPHLRLLASRQCSFDLQMTEVQYDQAFEVFSQVPELALVLCHCASPWDQSPEGFQRWQRAMMRFATLPNCYLKLSGFGMFRPQWQSEDIKPYVLEALELFGTNRVLAGTNFPVDKLYGGYDRIWTALEDLLGDAHVRRKVCHDNAAQFYRLDTGSPN